MKFNISREGCAKAAANENGGEISAGYPLGNIGAHDRCQRAIDKSTRILRAGFALIYIEWVLLGIEFLLHLYVAAFITLICLPMGVMSLLQLADSRRKLITIQKEVDDSYQDFLKAWEFTDERGH